MLVAVATGCAGGATTPTPPPAPSVASVAVSGLGGAATVGETVSLVAMATLSDGSTLTVTGQATWESTNAAVATVSSSGSVTFTSTGETELKATYKGITGLTRVSVGAAEVRLASLAVSISGTAQAGKTAQLKALATFSDDSTSDVTAQTTWLSSNTVVAAISPSGAVTFTAGGVVDLRGTYKEVSNVIQVLVAEAPPPPPPSGPTAPSPPPGPPVDVTAFYGTFNVNLSITSQSCPGAAPIVMAPTGTLVLSGKSDGTSFVATLTERGVGRPYYGTMNPDGSFGGFFSGLIPHLKGVPVPQHDADGTISGKVVGVNVTGGENLKLYLIECPPNGSLTTAFSGSK